ncbi:hypothetical protein N1851_032658 [Merluccius polli]|uniref:SCAN box domain-containing protein n=1 Tax=Merluccius polli TaxID=89951 RepID=A0AA47M2K8_MERPO|nr:hypothetical protein N1851_032658 [Merluccius polli]
MASAQVDLSKGYVGLTRDQFRRLTKEELISLAGVEDIELARDIRKPAIVAYLTRELKLEELWSEQQEQAKLQSEKEGREAVYAHSERLVRLEVEKLAITSGRHGGNRGSDFDLGRARRFMPVFEEDAVDVFFEMFEKVAKESEWPEEKWPLLVQSVMTGKAQRAVAALDCRLGLEYDPLKKAVLEAYGSVPEAYRLRFRELRRLPGETHLDFWRNQEIAMDRWLNSWEAFDYSEIRALVLLEQFKASVSREVEIYLNERAVKSPREAAELADNYEVIHGKKSTSEVGRRRPVDSFGGEPQSRRPMGDGSRPPQSFDRGPSRPERFIDQRGRSAPSLG